MENALACSADGRCDSRGPRNAAMKAFIQLKGSNAGAKGGRKEPDTMKLSDPSASGNVDK